MDEYIDKDADSNKVSIRAVTRILNISRSGFKSWKHRKKSHRQLHKERIKEMILTIYHENKEIYGAPKITYILRQKGIKISMKTVSNYMREMGIKACYIKHWTKTTLTSVMDLYSRKIISWVLTKDMKAESIIEAINIAKVRRNIEKPLVIHSDRGVQFTSEEYQKITMKMERSYSEKGTPWDNACIESFHSLIKREWLNRFKIMDYRQTYQLVFEYIETFYNTVRIHNHCGYMSPNNYESAFFKCRS